MKVTFATPTFGTSNYLEECIDSVCNQTTGAAHIVCAGNFSPTNPIQRENLRIVNKNPDPGMVACWNAAATLAKTEYIGFLADDNALQPSFVEKMSDFLDTNPDCDLVFCNQFLINEEGNINVEKSKLFTSHFGRDMLPAGMIDESYYGLIIEKNAIPLEASLIRRSVWQSFGPFKTEAKGSFDQEFLYRILLSKRKIGFIPQYLMNFRVHDGAYSLRQKHEHLIGKIWTSESLMANSDIHYEYFSQRNTFLKGRLLRHRLPIKQRIKILRSMLFKKKGLFYIVKNSMVRVLTRLRPLKG